jgi:hypothetical protein
MVVVGRFEPVVERVDGDAVAEPHRLELAPFNRPRNRRAMAPAATSPVDMTGRRAAVSGGTCRIVAILPFCSGCFAEARRPCGRTITLGARAATAAPLHGRSCLGRAEARQDLARHGETRPPKSSAGATSGGDGRRLRGIPAVSRGTSGAIAGTDPVSALLAKGWTGTQR